MSPAQIFFHSLDDGRCGNAGVFDGSGVAGSDGEEGSGSMLRVLDEREAQPAAEEQGDGDESDARYRSARSAATWTLARRYGVRPPRYRRRNHALRQRHDGAFAVKTKS